MLVKWVAFLATLHWPQGGVDLGVGGVSLWRCSFLYELWAGERLGLEKAVPKYRREGRSISVSAVPCSPGTGDLAGILVRYFVLLLVCMAVFVGSSLVKWVLVLITVGFGTLGGKGVVMASLPGLVSRPCCVVGWGVTLRYCSGKFACRVPTWSLPARGHVQGADVGGSGGVITLVVLSLPGFVVLECSVVGEFLGPLKEFGAHRKTPAHLGSFQSLPKVSKRSTICGVIGFVTLVPGVGTSWLSPCQDLDRGEQNSWWKCRHYQQH